MTIDPFVDQFISNLEKQFSKDWAPYLFHYSDITNIVSIIENGTLFSRNQCKNNKLLVKDSAGKDVLNHTSSSYMDHVRLYFRPKTPPLYHVKGFCPNDNQDSEFGAHCPVPVYLLFDSREILSDTQSQFSNGNLSSSVDLFYDKRDLNKLDFSLIYHNTWFTPDQRELIINWRCSEIIIPDQIQLDGVLKYIVCRSIAERETLINLFSDQSKEKYRKIIRVGISLFHRKKHYISNVNLQSSEISIKYNHRHQSPFRYTYSFKTESRERSYERDKPVLKWILKKLPKNYTFSIEIDGHIAYMGKFIS